MSAHSRCDWVPMKTLSRIRSKWRCLACDRCAAGEFGKKPEKCAFKDIHCGASAVMIINRGINREKEPHDGEN